MLIVVLVAILLAVPIVVANLRAFIAARRGDPSVRHRQLWGYTGIFFWVAATPGHLLGRFFRP